MGDKLKQLGDMAHGLMSMDARKKKKDNEGGDTEKRPTIFSMAQAAEYNKSIQKTRETINA